MSDHPRDEVLEAAARVLSLARHLPPQGRDEAEDVAAGLLSAANRI